MPRSYLDSPRPIAALATPPGESALAVIRAVGPACLDLAEPCFSKPVALRSAKGHSMVHGHFLDPSSGERIDEVVIAVFRAPKSPIGEDGFEISCHGSPVVVRRILAILESVGFAPALPGEFSFRAFIHGKTDLLRSEAVAELVSSRSESARAEALRRLEGGLSERIASARQSLVSLLAETEARLDHGDDDGSPADSLDPSAILAVRDRLAELSRGYAAGRLHVEGARVVVAGRPNAGKSSLFNLILREERSIVSSEAGTTRDWIEEEVEIEGYPVRVLDTAGLRESGDAVESEGVARSRRLVAEADAVIYVVDGIAGLGPEDEALLGAFSGRGWPGAAEDDGKPDSGNPVIIPVWNKVDAPACQPVFPGFLPVSASTGEGFPALASSIAAALSSRFGESRGRKGADTAREVHVASERQKLLLDRAVAALDSALRSVERGIALDALTLDLREAADALGEMSGEIVTDEILEAIFSRFCLGK